MDIGAAKDEIRRTVEIYLDTNEYGEYTVPYKKQRPIFITGAPGIGKTAVVEQTAAEMGIALVCCSMTHYTRQSALGLPYMAKKEYDGRTWQISEYALGEIMRAVYETMEESGKREGILFLDEINCVPDSLVPAVLNILQYKRLGNSPLPEGWTVVAAGSLPEYGENVRQFGIPLLDRMKCFGVEADFGVWKSYAYRQGIHAAVIAFLESSQRSFYFVGPAAGTGGYATPRGWEDLAREIRVYERKGFPVDSRLVFHYITNREIGKAFGDYYGRFARYREKYPIGEILGGNTDPGFLERAGEAGDEEKIALLEMLLEALNRGFAEALELEAAGLRACRLLRNAKRQIEEENLPLYAVLCTFQEQLRREGRRCQAANCLSAVRRREYRRAEEMLEGCLGKARREGEPQGQSLLVEREIGVLAEGSRERLEAAGAALERVSAFVGNAWGRGRETDFFRRELAANPDSGRWIRGTAAQV